MGGALGSVGNGFQNQENLTNEAGVSGDSSIILYPRMDGSPSYAGDAVIRDTVLGQYMYVPVPQYFTCAPVVPTTEADWRDANMYGVNPSDGTVLGCFAVNVDTASSSASLYFVQDDRRPANDFVQKALVKTLDEFSTDDAGTTALYHRGIFGGARRQNLFDGAITDPITGVDQGLKIFTVAGDKTSLYAVGNAIDVVNSTGNDGTYTPNTVVLNSGDTDITVDEVIPDPTVDGDLETIGIIRYEQKDTDGQNVDGELFIAGLNDSFEVPHVDGFWNGGLVQTSSYFQKSGQRTIGLYNNKQYVQAVNSATTLISSVAFVYAHLEVLSMDAQPPGTVCFRWAGDSNRDATEIRYKHPDGTWYGGIITADSTNSDTEPRPGLMELSHGSSSFQIIFHFGDGTTDLELTYDFAFSSPLV